MKVNLIDTYIQALRAALQMAATDPDLNRRLEGALASAELLGRVTGAYLDTQDRKNFATALTAANKVITLIASGAHREQSMERWALASSGLMKHYQRVLST